MNEEPKSIWKKNLSPAVNLCLWFVLFLALFFVGLAIFALTIANVTLPYSYYWLIAAGFALLAVGLIAFIRWFCCWRNFKRFLFGLACFITLIALFYVEEDWRGKHDWEKFKREWEAKGERFDRASVVPPPVPDAQNFALTPVVASSYLRILDQGGHQLQPPNTNIINRLEMKIYDYNVPLKRPTNGDWRMARASDLNAWQQYYRARGAKTNAFPVPPQLQTSAADVLLALSKYDSTIEELRRAGQLPHSRFPLQYDKDDPVAMLLPHLAPMKDCAQVLQLRALAEMQTGQSDQALADIKLLLRLTDSIRTEPILISHLVRIAIVNIALQPVWEGLAGHRWSDAQLAELERELARLDFLSDYKLALRGEMVLCQVGMFDYLRHHPEQLFNLAGDGGTVLSSALPTLSRLIPGGWFYQNQLRCARPMVEFYLPAADANRGIVSPATTRQGDAVVIADTKRISPYNVLERLLMPSLGNAVKRFASGQIAVNLARVACALERCRIAQGEYPAALDALAPQFITKLPPDIINGQPLHYRRDSPSPGSGAAGGHFVLYSIGWNETDDGGEVGLSKSGTVDTSTGDWVWRYPQK